MEHTKGEWTVRKDGKKKWEIEFSIWAVKKCSLCDHSVDTRIIGDIRESAVGLEEAEANAKLIAAAPEMLEVLETIENDANQVPEWLWLRIKAVIKKAKQ